MRSDIDLSSEGCGPYMIEYLRDLGTRYPTMRNWISHPLNAILDMTRIGNVEAIHSMQCICECIRDEWWQSIANTAARHGHMNIIVYVHSNYNVNWQTVATIARDVGNEEIASYSDGFDYVTQTGWSSDYDDFPLNLSGSVGDPMEDKGEYIIDWRMEDYKEEFLPEEPNIIGDDAGSYDDIDTFTPYNESNQGWGFSGELIDTTNVSEFEDDEDDDLVSDRYKDDVYMS